MAGKKARKRESTQSGTSPLTTEQEGNTCTAKPARISVTAAAGAVERGKKPKTNKINSFNKGAANERPAKPKVAMAARKLSALAASAKVLQESGQAMNCQQMIQTMAAKGFWTSP